jgi:8-oxo-dGTP pyrophosphatase MutT (NUDIX family)
MSWDRQTFIRRFSLLQTQAYRYPFRHRVSTSNHSTLRKAAVLIGVVERDTGCQVILTQRAKHLRNHPGQVSFPGGKVEIFDANLCDTAIRETHEEIGIGAEVIEVIGQLPELVTSSGFLVTPVLAMVKSNYHLNIDHNEVADVFEVPISYLMSSSNLSSLIVRRKNHAHQIYVIPYKNHLIWGATAQIIECLKRQVVS